MRLLVICVALFACGDHEAAQLERSKRQVCACKTSACAVTAMKLLPQHDVVAGHRAQGIARDMLECVAKLYAAERPSTDPDAGSATASTSGP
jgi:hypothetical protein